MEKAYRNGSIDPVPGKAHTAVMCEGVQVLTVKTATPPAFHPIVPE